jgi:hypothetical protein
LFLREKSNNFHGISAMILCFRKKTIDEFYLDSLKVKESLLICLSWRMPNKSTVKKYAEFFEAFCSFFQRMFYRETSIAAAWRCKPLFRDWVLKKRRPSNGSKTDNGLGMGLQEKVFFKKCPISCKFLQRNPRGSNRFLKEDVLWRLSVALTEVSLYLFSRKTLFVSCSKTSHYIFIQMLTDKFTRLLTNRLSTISQQSSYQSNIKQVILNHHRSQSKW